MRYNVLEIRSSCIHMVYATGLDYCKSMTCPSNRLGIMNPVMAEIHTTVKHTCKGLIGLVQVQRSLKCGKDVVLKIHHTTPHTPTSLWKPCLRTYLEDSMLSAEVERLQASINMLCFWDVKRRCKPIGIIATCKALSLFAGVRCSTLEGCSRLAN